MQGEVSKVLQARELLLVYRLFVVVTPRATLLGVGRTGECHQLCGFDELDCQTLGDVRCL